MHVYFVWSTVVSANVKCRQHVTGVNIYVCVSTSMHVSLCVSAFLFRSFQKTIRHFNCVLNLKRCVLGSWTILKELVSKFWSDVRKILGLTICILLSSCVAMKIYKQLGMTVQLEYGVQKLKISYDFLGSIRNYTQQKRIFLGPVRLQYIKIKCIETHGQI